MIPEKMIKNLLQFLHLLYFIFGIWGGGTKNFPYHAFLVVLTSVCTLAAYAVISVSLNHRGLKYCINSIPFLFAYNFVVMSVISYAYERHALFMIF
jgi:hypothetical protein